MRFDPTLQHRKSIRWKGYDYSARGLYFVTICTHNRVPSLSRIEGRKSVLTGRGKAVHATWMALPERFPTVEVGPFVVMPNHVHGILAIVGKAKAEGAASSAPTLGEIMRAFKSLAAREIRRVCGKTGQVWQRNYYEHVIRDGREYGIICRYIWENPARWETDPENPAAKTHETTPPWV